MSDILAMRGISVCNSKILFKNNFSRHAHDKCSIYMHESSAQSFYTIWYCMKTYGSPWNVLKEFCNQCSGENLNFVQLHLLKPFENTRFT